MKRTLFALAVIAYCISCNTNTGTSTANAGSSDAAQKNLAAAHGVNAAVISGNVNNLDSFIAKDAVDHSGMMGDIKGLDSIKAELGKIHTSSTDMKVETVKEFADNDYVFQWLHFTGTAATPDMGMPAGTKYDMNAVEVSKFNSDGKATDHWEFIEPAEMMKMMQQQNTGGMKMDTTKHK
jgi:predicted SnoaL-like aldol condensation-catalyzing enzyme